MNRKKVEELKAQAEKGLTPYQIELGHSYLTGVDYDGNAFPQDFSEAKLWLERAHEKGAFTATVILGTMYEEGRGIPVNIPKAIELYKLAVEQGAYLPCVYLARIYSQGKGVEQSPQQAAEWYQKVLSFEGEVDDEGEMDEARKFLATNEGRF
jgi:TPR repeat protein